MAPGAASRAGGVLEPANVRALRLEGSPHHPGPPRGLLHERIHHHARVLVVAPNEHAWARARNCRPERPERRGALHQLDGAWIEMSAMRLMEAIAKPGGDQVQVGAGQAEDPR